MAHLPLSQVMTLVYATIGPVADYGTCGRWLLLISTAICWAAQFASMSLTCRSQHLKPLLRCALRRQLAPGSWGTAMALYIISFASRGITQSFYSAPFPHLARNTPHSRELRRKHERGELSPEAYEKERVIEKSKMSSISMVRSRASRSIIDDTIRSFVFSLAMLLRCHSTCHCCFP